MSAAALPPPEARALWEARPNMVVLWLLAVVAVAIASLLLWTWFAPAGAEDCTGACAGGGAEYVFGAVAVLMAAIALPLALLIPIGGFDLRYRLLADRLTIRRRIFGWVRRRELAVPGHIFSLGRSNHIYIYPEIDPERPKRGMRALLIGLSRRDRDALRDALPEGAWR